MLRAWSLCFLALAVTRVTGINDDWWKTATIYQVYPRSFKDSNGDGVGDLNGITSKLEHLVDAGIEGLWLSPIYTSPMADFGYDVANFTDIDPIFGTLADFDKLVARAKSFGLKVLLDFVPNHSSTECEWFKKSIKRIKPYDEYYIWRDAKVVNGTRHPPNNWLSNFYGSAWEWNDERGQYYYHAFAAGQPDLNYRSASVNQQMKDVLSFWLKRGVDGFRIDAINSMFEDERLLDEPVASNSTAAPDDFDYLDHIYTKNQDEMYDVIRNWRTLLDDYANSTNTDFKLMMTEAYSPLDKTLKFYEVGSNVPFNFYFIRGLNNQSKAIDYKGIIDLWISNMPRGYVANWVTGNHDNPRVASRLGRTAADSLSMLAAILPGVTIIYNGDEIAMEDTFVSWEDTVDPAGCNAGRERYQTKSRDPERTPFQWDATRMAGFTTGNSTWLPVNENYVTLNLAAQKNARISHFKVFQALTALKKHSALRNGTLKVHLVNDEVLGVVRRTTTNDQVVLLTNFSNSTLSVDAMTALGISKCLTVYTASVHSTIQAGVHVKTNKLTLPGLSSVVLTNDEIFRTCG